MVREKAKIGEDEEATRADKIVQGEENNEKKGVERDEEAEKETKRV